MNRKDFGRLIAALRIEQRDEQDHRLSQTQLAEMLGISKQMLGKIERGEKVILDADLLLKFARAFRLSSRERDQFFNAALGPENGNANLSNSVDQVLEQVIHILGTITLPSFVVDSYDEIIAANRMIMALFDFSEQLRKEAPTLVGGYSVLRVVFSKRSQFRAMMGSKWDAYALQSINFFKMVSFQARATDYFRFMMDGFKRDKDMLLFNSMYYGETINPEKDDYYFETVPAVFKHEMLGELLFYSPPIAPVTTPYGNLYLVSYLPASAKTVRAFAELAEHCGQGVARLAPWPQKSFAVVGES